MEQNTKKMLYILKLEHGCFYIGTSQDVEKRIGNHLIGNGAGWTKIHPILPSENIETKECPDGLFEDYMTKRYMLIHGIDKVRGGSYVQAELPPMQLWNLEKEFSTAQGCCFLCKRTDHYVNRCPNREAFCERCGFNSHFIETCRAKRGIDGKYLKPGYN